MQRIGSALLVIAFSLVSSSAVAAMKAKSLKAYQGPDGVQVWIVRLEKKKEALVKVMGTDTELDGTVQLAEISEWDGKEDYSMRWKGQKYNVVTQRSGSYEVYPPGKRGNGVSISYDKSLSAAAKPEQIVAEFETKKK